jgi:hypothetical protein
MWLRKAFFFFACSVSSQLSIRLKKAFLERDFIHLFIHDLFNDMSVVQSYVILNGKLTVNNKLQKDAV